MTSSPKRGAMGLQGSRQVESREGFQEEVMLRCSLESRRVATRRGAEQAAGILSFPRKGETGLQPGAGREPLGRESGQSPTWGSHVPVWMRPTH